MEEIVTFNNKDNLRLVGIETIPVAPNPVRKGVILLNTGVNYRIAWHRLNVKLAKFLSEEGFFVLRFDTHGIGDSEGELKRGNIVDIFEAIQKGLFVDDTIKAIKYFKEKEKLNKIYLLGLCGGALTAMYAASKVREVEGIIHIAGPITLSSEHHLENKHPWEARNTLLQYGHKIISFNAWLRFFSGASEYKTIHTSLKTLFGSFLRTKRLKKFSKFKKDVENEQDNKSWDNLNIDFIESFKNYCASGRKILFIFADKDAATWEFRTMFLNTLLKKEKYKKNYKYSEINDTNHIFSSTTSQETLKVLIKTWFIDNA